jgi:hypothetical protein
MAACRTALINLLPFLPDGALAKLLNESWTGAPGQPTFPRSNINVITTIISWEYNVRDLGSLCVSSAQKIVYHGRSVDN